eukprot:131185-Prorocentrum_minimum.AAC.1
MRHTPAVPQPQYTHRTPISPYHRSPSAPVHPSHSPSTPSLIIALSFLAWSTETSNKVRYMNRVARSTHSNHAHAVRLLHSRVAGSVVSRAHRLLFSRVFFMIPNSARDSRVVNAFALRFVRTR